MQAPPHAYPPPTPPRYPPPRAAAPEPPAPPEPPTPRFPGPSAQQVLSGTAVVTVLGFVLAAAQLGTGVGLAVAALVLVASGACAFLVARTGAATTAEALAVTSVLTTAVAIGLGASREPTPALLVAALAASVALLWTALQVAPDRLRTWPLAALLAAQVAGLAWLSTDPRPLDTPVTGAVLGSVLLAVAGGGLAVAWTADGTSHGLLSRVGLLTAVPWWVSGVVVAQQTAWSGEGDAVLAAALTVLAGAGLLVTAADRVPALPTGDRDVVPVLSGVTAGLGVAGAAHVAGAEAVSLSGVAGLLLAALVAVAAARGEDWVPRDAGLAVAAVLTVLAVLQDAAAGRWSWVALLLVFTALASGLLSARRSETRPETVPLTVGAVAAALVLALTDAPAAGVGAVLVVVAVTGVAQAVVLARRPTRAPSDRAVDEPGHPDLRAASSPADGGSRVPAPDEDADRRASGPTATTGAVTGLIGVLVAAGGDPAWATPVLLTVLGATLLGYATATQRSGAGQLGAGLLVLAAWSATAQLGWTGLERWTVPLALGLLLARGRELGDGPSWPTWGPPVAVGLLPSLALVLLDPAEPRHPLLLLAGLAVVLVGVAAQLRAPFQLGTLAVGGAAIAWAVDAVPGPWLLVLLAVGVLLFALAWGADREVGSTLRERVAAFR